MTEKDNPRGLFIINTGNGKGKTTAALGTAIRAAGQGLKVCIIQFIKGKWKTGEQQALKRFDDCIELHIMGKGFTWESKDIKQDKQAAQHAWQKAESILADKNLPFDLLILDELTYLIPYNFVELNTILTAFQHRNPRLHLIVTGRNAPEEMIKTADLVSEIQPVKHPFEKGIPAQKGIDF